MWWLDEVGIVFVIFEQTFLIFRQAEKIGLVFHPFDGCAGGRKLLAVLAFGEFVFAIESFVADRIPAFICAEINVRALAGFVGCNGFPNGLTGFFVTFLGGAYEIVI